MSTHVTPATPAAAPRASTGTPTAASAATGRATAAATCRLCDGTGWVDPVALGDDTPELVACDRCLGFGLADCPECEGEGVLAPPRPCLCQERTAA